MEDWKHNIKELIELEDANSVVSAKELQSKWRIVEEGLNKRKLKPLWITISGIAAGVILLIGVFALYNKNNYSSDSRQAKMKEAIKSNPLTESVVAGTDEKTETGAVVKFKRPNAAEKKLPLTVNINDQIFKGSKTTDSLFSHSIPLLVLNAEEKSTGKKVLARSRQKSRKSITINGSATGENNVAVKQKTGINMMDYVDLTEKGRHEDEKREDKNTIIKF